MQVISESDLVNYLHGPGLGSYADDSHDQRMDKIISAGALIGWPYLIFDAECHWQNRIDRDGIKYFRSFDCENLIGEFDPHKHGDSAYLCATTETPGLLVTPPNSAN